MDNLVLLDVSAMMYRAYYSLINMRNKEGAPTGAIFGFTNILLSIIDEFKPKYMAACFDVKRSTLERTKIYADYKAHRKPMPDDLVAQIEGIENIIEAFGIKKYKVDGHEADDLLGSLAKHFSKEDINVIVITGDKDLSQIIDKNIQIALLGKGQGKDRFKILSTDADVVEQLGVEPKLIPDLFGLIGDSSDGIPGVRKVGEKKAVPMLLEYGSLEGVYENVDKLSDLPGIGKGLVKNIIEDKELAFLSRELAVINCSIELEYNREDILIKDMDKELMGDLLQKYNFVSISRKLGLTSGTTKSSSAIKPKSLFDNSDSETEVVVEEKKYVEDNIEKIIIKNIEELNEIVDKSKEMAIIFNGAGVILAEDNAAYYVSLHHENYNNFDVKEINNILNRLKKVTCYNYKQLIKDGFNLKNIYVDVMLAYYLLYANTKEDLDMCLFNEIGASFESYKDRFGKEELQNLDPKDLIDFYGVRAKALLTVGKEIKSKLIDEDLIVLYNDIEFPLSAILAKMEIIGIKIDKEHFAKYQVELKEALEILENKIFELSGVEFNINSPKQLGEILFDELGIEPVQKTKSGYSTNVEVLETLVARGEIIPKYILEYRKLSKLLNTYVEALPKLIDENDRLHTTFNQTGTSTGRLSSSNPNLQNIPAKTNEGMRIREGFIAKDGYTLLSIDYSQIELRVLAEISGDENLINAYKDDLDLHRLTAIKIFDLDDDAEISNLQRNMAKIINFSIIYGKTAFGLSKELNISRYEAKDYIDKYFNQYKKVKKLEEDIINIAKEQGFVRTKYNRKRVIDGINSSNKNLVKQAERMAVNTVIQGTAADILKMVMIKINDKIKDFNDITMNLQVHDELIFEIKDDKVLEYGNLIKEIMENSIKLEKVFLKANMAYGKNWSEAK